MLHAISLSEYFSLMGLGLLVYYGWWLVRYFPSLRLGSAGKPQGRQVLPEKAKMVAGVVPASATAGGANGKPVQAGAAVSGPSKVLPAVAGVAEVGMAGVTADSAVVVAEEVAPAAGLDSASTAAAAAAITMLELPFPAAVDKPVLLPVVAGDLWNEVKALVVKASEAEMVEGGLVFAFQQLLKKEPFCRLRGTHFEKKISEQIVAELVKHGPVRVGMDVVSGWWK
jgi:hypothetical protein